MKKHRGPIPEKRQKRGIPEQNDDFDRDNYFRSLEFMSRRRFVAESNRIEGILTEPTHAELQEFDRFMALEHPTITDLEKFVSVYQPGATLRDKPGMNVVVGTHVPPPGGPIIRATLEYLMAHLADNTAYENHCRYETLHPFTDGNGRSGRAVWAWQMKELPLGFLHKWYYQSLQEHGMRKEH